MTDHQPLVLHTITAIGRTYTLKKPLEFVVTTTGKRNGVIEYSAEDKAGLGLLVYSSTYGELPNKIADCFDLCYRTVMGEKLELRDRYKRVVSKYINTKVA